MKIKYFFYQSYLVITLLLSGVAFAQNINVDFDNSKSFGIAPDKIELQNVVVETSFNEKDSSVYDEYKKVLLKACPYQAGNLSYLMPVLTAVEPPCGTVEGVNFRNSRSFGGGVNIMHISVDTYDPDVSHFRNVIATYKFNSGSLRLTPMFLPAPSKIKVLFDWGDMPRELDAHLTGPAPGKSESRSNAKNRFHIYFDNRDYFEEVNDLPKNNNSKEKNEKNARTNNVEKVDKRAKNNKTRVKVKAKVASFKIGDNFAKPQILTVYPPPKASVLRPGIYQFTIHHYAGSGSIVESKARVRLRIDDMPEQVFTPPRNNKQKGYLNSWTVFELEVTKNSTTVRLPRKSYTNNISPPEVP